MEFTIQHLVSLLVPPAPGVRLTDIVVLPDLFVLRLRATAPSARCPTCSQSSSDRHSRYTRTLADLPWGTCTIQLLLTVRKFRCANPTCPRRVFTERVPALVAPYARQTARRQAVLRAIGLALGGQAGAQLAGQLGLSTSRDSLLRLVQRTPLPPYCPPRVVGIDDWSRRRVGALAALSSIWSASNPWRSCPIASRRPSLSGCSNIPRLKSSGGKCFGVGLDDAIKTRVWAG